ncbi:DUF3499 family protein [Actinomarinicola tropica]|uniref:DUF3499 family protein n=1 Tax=Actinomarinicola tropica TaxID=2789776 RepID=A0A5Q2RQ06_9ACTN|nr:DUF3499 family protein [Actinomarinicola tropica]QGG96207.1 DUF3499 family protein [Actinomarinicola tropica]
MARVCSRPGCSAPATVTFTFEPDALVVWVGDLAPDATAPGHDLCAEHGERLSAPRGWRMEDVRANRPPLPKLDADSPMLSRAFRGVRAS